MKIMFNGKFGTYGDLIEAIEEVICTAGDNVGVPDGTEIQLENVQLNLVFNINGKDSYATVERDINGEVVNEMLTLSIHLDENGKIIQTEDNEEESFYDNYTLARSVGKDYVYTGTESKYKNEELEIIESMGENSDIDVMAVRYKVKAEPEVEVVRHYKGDTLIAEYEYRPKEESK